MTRRVYVQINGVETDISDGVPLEIIDITNLGASAASRITERSPAQDGDTDIGRRLEPRIIPIVLQARPDGVETTYETCRRLINRLFKSTSVAIVLGVAFDDGTVYHIDTQSVGDIELPFNLLATHYIRAGVNLRAANPTFYDPALKSLSFGIAGGGDAFEIPSFVPTFFGVNTLDQTNVIEYGGTYRDFPVFQVYGPFTDLIITNIATGAKLDFTGHTVTSGDVWTIDLRFGRKQIYRNGDPDDTQLYRLSDDSNIASFAIEADPEAVDGINPINVNASGLSGLSQVYLQYYHRFDGI